MAQIAPKTFTVLSGWLFERNRVIGRYFKIALTISYCFGHIDNRIIVVCVILASIDLSLFPHCSLFLSNNQPEMYCTQLTLEHNHRFSAVQNCQI